MKKLIIGFVGEIGAGKDTAADYLTEQYQATKVSFGTMLMQIAQTLHLPNDREHLTRISEMVRHEFGQDMLAKVIAEDVKNLDAPMICVPNVRRHQDITYLRELPNFILIHITAEPRTRYERITTRGEKADDATKTWEQFLQDAQLPTEVTIREVAATANHAVSNDGSPAELYQQVEAIIKQYVTDDQN